MGACAVVLKFGDSRLPERFWQKVKQLPATSLPEGCWEWTAATNSDGYSSYWHEGTMRSGYKVCFESLVGSVPKGLTLDHLCRNRRCVHPAHLEPVTNVKRGDLPALVGLRQRSKTTCPHGHPYSGANLYVEIDGSRGCKACRSAQYQAFIARRRAS
jgi:hypothetical protein